MDNRDFLPYLRVANTASFDSPLLRHRLESHSFSLWLWLKRKYVLLHRFLYKRFHDFCASLFGYLTLNEKLYVAVHENNVETAKKLLANGAAASFIPWNHQMMIGHLIQNTNRIRNSVMNSSLTNSVLGAESMLYVAVFNNNFTLVKELIQYHNYGAVDQHTEVVALCLAIKRGYTHIVEYLIDYGHINPNDSVQMNCKHCKAHSRGANRYYFPLYHACRENHLHLVKYLIEVKRCDVNQLNSFYESSLHGAILGAIENQFDSSANSQQRYQIVKYLLAETRCNPNMGLNPLCISIIHESVYDYTSLLLQYHCHVDRLGWNLQEPTNRDYHQMGCRFPYPLDHPLNICLRLLMNTTDSSIATGYFAHRQHARAMISHQANIYAMADYGSKYPLLLAVQAGDKVLVQSIFEHCQNYIRFDLCESSLIHACVKSYYDIVQLFIDTGFNPNRVVVEGCFERLSNPKLDDLDADDFLRYLDRYCLEKTQVSLRLTIKKAEVSSKTFNEHELTPFLALSRMPSWIFHRDRYTSTMNTLAALTSKQSIDFSIAQNRFGFHYALTNEHFPLVYYCLEHFCPIVFLNNNIEFRAMRSQNHFFFTLFHLISVACRLTANPSIQRALLDSYSNYILSSENHDRATTVSNTVAYLNVWLSDRIFLDEPSVLNHLKSIIFRNELFQIHDGNQLKFMLNSGSQQLIDDPPIPSLKHLCRLKIRRNTQIYCENHQKNLLVLVDLLANSLPQSLISYLFYSRTRSKSLINRLIDREPWNSFPWI